MDEDEETNIYPNFHYGATFYPKILSHAIKTQRIEESDVHKLLLIKKFEFSSELQRMSVVVRNNIDREILCYIKGSPESIQSLCDEESIPKNYSEQLDNYTSRGFRVIALAYRTLNMDESDFDDNVEREKIERVSSSVRIENSFNLFIC
jgi:P-type E1-E2 ATPase